MLKKILLLNCIIFFLFGSKISWANEDVIEIIKHFGITLPKGSQRVSNNLFESPLPYLRTKRFFYFKFLRNRNITPYGPEKSLSHLRSISYKNKNENADFKALNIYVDIKKTVTYISFIEANNNSGIKN